MPAATDIKRNAGCQNQNLIRRWDNAEHHPHPTTFPFHIHIP
ncbi:MAG: toxin-antitoxin system TumE family protein [bacterium]